MRSDAETVDAYLAEAPAERREVLAAIRKLCLDNLTPTTEHMCYGMPTYEHGGVLVAAFASQRNYISLYFEPAVVAAHRAELAGASCGKSCVRYSRPDKIDFALVAVMLRESAQASHDSHIP